jgi:hypothetical protein
MKTKRKCKVCGKNPPAVPDRNNPKRFNEVCRQCHAGRLRGDLEVIMHQPLPGQMELFEEKL